MGFRKATAVLLSDQETEVGKTVDGPSGQVGEATDPSSWSKPDKPGYAAKDTPGAKSFLSKKRKNSILGSKSKRLRIYEDLIELKLTWEDAQGLLRPPPNHAPSVVVIEGFELEEYEDAPVLGKPTIFAADTGGEKIQWVQCEDCSNWRKIPADSLLPSKWTCSDNKWDSERSSCSAAQELTQDELEELIRSSTSVAASKKLKAPKEETTSNEALEGLDTLANLAILGEGDGTQISSQATTTKHPRHRPGCTCIVCIQPPSGKGPKHKQTCTCNVCLTVKRRFRTLMMRREKKQSEKEVEDSEKKPQSQTILVPNKAQEEDLSLPDTSPSRKKPTGQEGSDENATQMKKSDSPFRGQIDLNIQPEREDESSPCSDSGNGTLTKPLKDATEGSLDKHLLLLDESRSSPVKDPTGIPQKPEVPRPPPSADG